MRAAVLVLAGLVAGAVPVPAQTRADAAAPAQRGAPRNPSYLHASELLAGRDADKTRRIRFEWDQVGAPEYVLQGQWVEPGTWATRKREVTVTARSASVWDERVVAVELGLDPGAHSWSVVAVFPGKSLGDFAHPTRLSFEVK